MTSKQFKRLRKCIICLKEPSETSFKSKEHVIPHGLGRDATILSNGVVCDICNGKMSVYEGSFENWPLISPWKVWFRDKNRKKKYPKALLNGFEMQKDSPKNIRFTLSQDAAFDVKEMPDGQIHFTFKNVISSGNFVHYSRCLFKIAFEFLADTWGHEALLRPEMQYFRDYLLNDNDDYRPFALLDRLFFRDKINFEFVGPMTITNEIDVQGLLMVFAGRIFYLNLHDNLNLDHNVSKYCKDTSISDQWLIFDKHGKITSRI